MWENPDNDAKGLGLIASLLYNDKGELISMTVTADGNKVKHTYRYTSYDNYGNWTARIHKDTNGNEYLESRTLKYGTRTTAAQNKNASPETRNKQGEEIHLNKLLRLIK